MRKTKAGYTISSVFASTPALGNAEKYEEIADWLWRYALVLEPHERSLQGVAHFTNLEPGCLLDAMQRLAWQENVVMELNRQLNSTSDSFWADIQHLSDKSLEELDTSVDWSEEIVPTPEQYCPTGHKHREPLGPL